MLNLVPKPDQQPSFKLFSTYRCRPQNFLKSLRLSSVSLASLFLVGIVAVPAQAEIDTGPGQTFFEVGATGTGPFDTADPTFGVPDPNAGNDASDSNDIVRTFDTVSYDVVYTISNTPSTDVIIEVQLSSNRVDGLSGQEWLSLPGVCGAGSSINGDTLICNLGTISAPAGGSAGGVLTTTARIRPDTPHGSQVNAAASITAQGEPLANLGTVTSRVSATPKPDLSKTGISDASDPDLGINPTLVGIRPDPSGQTADTGVVYAYPLALLISGGKGGESLTGPLSITDDLSQFPVGTRLYVDTDGNAANDGDYDDDNNGCNWNGPTNTTGVGLIRDLPYGKTTANAGVGSWDDEQAVPNSGDWTCTQVGQSISIQITNADLTGLNTPSLNQRGNTITATDKYLLSGVVMIWVPLSAVTGSGGSLTVTNSYDAISVTGISGTTVTESGAPITNNDTEHTLVSGSGGFNTYYINSPTFADRFTPVLGQTQINSGNGAVLPTQTFGKRLAARNNGVEPWNSLILCDKIDNQTQLVTELTAGGIAHDVFLQDLPIGATFDYRVEYGTGDYATLNDQRLARCDDGDSPDGWHSNINAAALGGPENITKVRLVAESPLPSGTRVNLLINLTARSFEPDGDPILPGRVLSNHSASKVDSINNGNWQRGSYDPNVHDRSLGRGDRLYLTRALARVEKFVNGNNKAASAQVDDTVTFTLNPTLSAPIPTTVQTTVTLTDTLPKFLNYQVGTDQGCTTSCTLTVQNNTDGTTTLTWTWTNISPGDPIPDVSFDAQASDLTTTGTTLTNQAIIASPDDFTPEAQRTDAATVTIENPASFALFKETVTPSIPQNGQITYRLSLANTGRRSFNSGTFIDVFPYNNDGRTPVSDFVGTLGFVSITSTTGETFEYTNESDYSKFNDDPALVTGVTWCTEVQFGTPGCPEVGGGDVTAVLINMAPFPRGEPVRELTLTLQTGGTDSSNSYTNRFTGRPQGLGVLSSTALPVTVEEPDAQVSPLAGQLIINEVLYAQTGGNSAAGNDEFIELFNASGNSLDISGFQLIDGNLLVSVAADPNALDGTTGSITGNQMPYVFPPGTVLQPEDYAVIWVGDQNDASGQIPERFAAGAAFQDWLGSSPKLNNTGDDVWLYDADTKVIDYIAYGSGSAINTPPDSSFNLWDDTDQNKLDGASRGQSISLTPNGQDGNTSACWEKTTIVATDSDSASTRCPGFLETRDTDDAVVGGNPRITTVGENNNGSANNPNLLLVKRITRVNGQTTNGSINLDVYVNDATYPYDDNTLESPEPDPVDTENWPNTTGSTSSTFLRGVTNGGVTQPGDEIEYTIYFLSAGETEAVDVQVCDRIPNFQTFVPDAFNAASPAPGVGQGANRGILVEYNGNSLAYSNDSDGDTAQFFPPSSTLPSACGGAPLQTEDNGAVVVNLGDLPNADSPGSPSTSYGLIRFRAIVK